jgi:hypothetical protein
VIIVFHALNWAVVLVLLALWSLGSWAVHAIATWTVAGAGSLAGSTPALDSLQFPDWLALWLPPEATLLLTSLQSSIVPVIESALAQMPGLAGGISALVWVAWGIGGVLLVLLGIAGSGLVAFLSRKGKL